MLAEDEGSSAELVKNSSFEEEQEDEREKEKIEQPVKERGVKKFLANRIAFFTSLGAIYTWKFMILLGSVQFLLKGVNYIVVQRASFLFKKLNLEAERTQILLQLAGSPWAIKAIMGVLSDSLALGEKRKKWWLVIAAGFGIGGCVFLLAGRSVPLLLAFGLFGLSFQNSFSDLLVEGKYSEVLRDNPSSNGIITFSNGCQQLGYVVGYLLIGPLLDAGLEVVLFFICLFMAVSVVPLELLNFLPEERVEKQPEDKGWSWLFLSMAKFRKEKALLLLACASGLVSPALALLPIFLKGTIGLVLTTCIFYAVVLTLIFLSYKIFPSKYVAVVALFEFFKRCQRPSLDTALDFYYTSSVECCPSCPHLSLFWYVTVGGIVSSVAAVFALFLYEVFFKKLSFRNVVIVTLILQVVGSSTDLLVLFRLNLRLGIPDVVAVLLGDSIIQPICQMLNWIPGAILLSKVCPPGLESSTFAFVAGISNLSLHGSYLSGALIMDLVGLKTTVPCNMTSLPVLVAICHSLLPLVIGVGTAFLLLPNTPQDSSLLEKQKSEEISLDDMSS